MDIFKLPVFPAADVFPMMTEEELAELAADIKANGQREPVVTAEVFQVDLDESEMMLIDGRNRRAACEIAGVKPTSRELNGEDPTAFVISANIHRRHMTVGQRAMAVAIIYPDPEKGGRGQKATVSVEFISPQRLSYARTVLRHAPDLSANVLSGSISLDAAYKVASDLKLGATGEVLRLARLRKHYPDLADKVVEEDLTLPGAEAEAEERTKQAKHHRQSTYNYLAKINHVDSVMGTLRHVEAVIETLDAYPGDFEIQERHSLPELHAACVRLPVQLKELAKLLKERIKLSAPAT